MFRFLNIFRGWLVLAIVFGCLVGCSDSVPEAQDNETETPAPAYNSGRVAHYGYGSLASAAWELGQHEIAIDLARDLLRIDEEGREVFIGKLRMWALDVWAQPRDEDSARRLHLIASVVPIDDE